MKRFCFIVFLVFGSSLMFTGCLSYDRCVTKYGRVQSELRAPVELRADMETQFTSLPFTAIPLLIPGEVKIIESDSTRAKIKYWRDKYSEALNIEAICDSIILRDTILVPRPVILDPPPPGKIAKAWNGFANIAGVILVIQLIILVIALLKLSTFKLKL